MLNINTTADRAYQNLISRILSEGKQKGDRTGTGTLSIRSHNLEIDMAQGFPLLTTKKMFTKGIIHELLWFLNGDTNIKYLVDNNVNIWTPDAYREFHKCATEVKEAYECGDLMGTQPHIEAMFSEGLTILTMDEFKEAILTNTEFAEEHGELGPIYGKQWVRWGSIKETPRIGWLHKREDVWCVKWTDLHSFAEGTHWCYTDISSFNQYKYNDSDEERKVTFTETIIGHNPETFSPHIVATVSDNPTVNYKGGINQIQNAIDTLNNNPDSRRIMVSAWNVGDIDKMALPPCHWAFELYTEELTWEERSNYCDDNDVTLYNEMEMMVDRLESLEQEENRIGERMSEKGVPTRRLSLKWHQRSVDTFLGLPFNIASYALLLHMFAQQTNMIPHILEGDLTNVHIYNNHIEQCKEQLVRLRKDSPKLDLNKASDMFNYSYDSFKIVNYESHPTIKGEISV